MTDWKQRKAPVLRFKGFTDVWEQRKLGEVAQIVRGASPRPINNPKWFDSESNIGWLRISDVTSQKGKIYHLEQHISKLGQQKTRVVTTPHLLLSIAASVGYPVINYVPTGVHDGFIIFENLKLNIDFGFFWLQNFRPIWKKYGQPGSQVNLNRSIVSNTKICFPSNIEQRKEDRRSFESNHKITISSATKIKKIKLLKRAMLQNLFTCKSFPKVRFKGFLNAWEQRKLGDVAIFFNGRAFRQNELLENGKYKVLRVGNFYTNNSWYYSNLELDNKYYINKGDLIYTWSASFGPHIWNGEKVIYHYHIWKIQPSQFIDKNFLMQVLENDKNKLIANVNGSTMVHITKNDMENKKIFLPNKREQYNIGKILAIIDQSISLQQQKVKELQQTKEFLLQNMFI
ncbi:restriction endonuclease subunit S [Lactobacillus kefiranofaciens]|uniref:Restriction endonuclease subunit S n=5 Tax=Lactobacillus kefiranofaciens TaxID=267818 RepID=A0AAX3UFK1_9LACO|nr:restriction endonuclease subunit S [Lactobacillus kefiranofaciens]WGO86389.1 restriction endonuclease subunit S [Lactobacillus kefiranofaciens]